MSDETTAGGFFFEGGPAAVTFTNCRASDGDDTAYVQGFLDQGVPLPPGDYRCPDGVTVPGDYCELATAAGRTPGDDGSFRVADAPAVIRFRVGHADLSAAWAHPGRAKVPTELGRRGYAMYLNMEDVENAILPPIADMTLYCGASEAITDGARGCEAGA